MKKTLILAILLSAGCIRPKVSEFRLGMPLFEVQEEYKVKLISQYMENDKEFYIYSVDVDSQTFGDLSGHPYLLTFESGKLIRVDRDEQSLTRRAIRSK